MKSSIAASLALWGAHSAVGAGAFQALQPQTNPPKPSASIGATICYSTSGCQENDVSRRSFFGALGLSFGTLLQSESASAKYGASSNMELPNYIDFLIEKNNSGLSSANALYKGADPAVLLRRIEEANNRLGEVEALAEKKKWSQIQGLLTGPLGTLSQTLNQIATPDSPKPVLAASKKLKADLIAIGQAASKKNGEGCIALAKEASKDLIVFLETTFE